MNVLTLLLLLTMFPQRRDARKPREPRALTGDVYVAQTAAGSGMSCASAVGLDYLGTAANWIPGNTFHLCGTFTFAGGARGIVALASGTAGQPINIVFEDGAVLQSPYFAGSPNPSSNCLNGAVCGAIDTNGKSYIVIDGRKTGVIRNTANGSSLANRKNSIGVHLSGDRLTVRNLTIRDIYVASADEPTTWAGQWTADIGTDSASNYEICGNTLLGARTGLWISSNWPGPRTEGPTTCDDKVAADGANAYNNFVADHCWSISLAGSGYINIYNNEVTDWTKWFVPTTGEKYHLDGIIAYGAAAGAQIKPFIYNNYIHGDQSGGISSGFIYCTYGLTPNGTDGSACTIYNNVLAIEPKTSPQQTNVTFYQNDDGGQHKLGPHYAYNNTLVGSTQGDFYKGADKTTLVTLKNNIVVSNAGWYYQFNSTPETNVTSDGNVFYGGRNYGGTTGGFSVGSVSSSSLAVWQEKSRQDAHSVETNPKLSDKYRIGDDSPAHKIGANLTTVGIQSLNVGAPGKVGTSYTCEGGCYARHTSDPWDAGAYPVGGATPVPPAGQATTISGDGPHTTCTPPEVNRHFLCIANDGIWTSSNGEPYVRAAGVASVNGKTGAVTITVE